MTPEITEILNPSIVQLRLMNYLMTAFNFGTIAVALLVFVNRKDIGHKTLIRMAIIFCSMIAGDSAFGAWNLYHRHVSTMAMMRFGTAVFGTACVTYFLVTNRDILRTLRISELWDRLKKDKIADGEQARMQIDFLGKETLLRSEALLMARTKL